jgi:hypothetical protein
MWAGLRTVALRPKQHLQFRRQRLAIRRDVSYVRAMRQGLTAAVAVAALVLSASPSVATAAPNSAGPCHARSAVAGDSLELTASCSLPRKGVSSAAWRQVRIRSSKPISSFSGSLALDSKLKLTCRRQRTKSGTVSRRVVVCSGPPFGGRRLTGRVDLGARTCSADLQISWEGGACRSTAPCAAVGLSELAHVKPPRECV